MGKIIKKFFFRLLVNKFTGSVIHTIYPRLIPDIRWRGYKFTIQRNGVNKSLAASLFCGFYEAAEIRFIHQYYKGKTDVIELGGSMGIVTSHLASLQEPGKKLITVEANPFLAETLIQNVKRYLKAKSQFSLLTNAIAYHSDEVSLQITGNSTETKVVAGENNLESGKVVVKSIKLSDIINKYVLNEFTLVSDIEGAEAELLHNESVGLAKCKEIFIELHDTVYKNNPITIEDLKSSIIGEHKFILVDQNGPVIYFKRP